jgi:acyl dehydratase
MTKTLFFEDLQIGTVIDGDEVIVDRDEMLNFARRFDPQPFHLDKLAAQQLSLQDVIASGAFTFALGTRAMQPVVRQLAFLPSGLGFELSFKAPVYSGDRLKFRSEVAELRPSSKPGRGVAKMKHQFLNQRGQSVLEISNVWLIATRTV